MAKRTYKITRFDGGRNSKYDARDIQEEEIAEAINVGVINPGYFAPSGNFRNYYNASDNAIQLDLDGDDSYVVTEFERDSTSSSEFNNSLFAFAHDYGLLFKVHFDSGESALLVIGAIVTDNNSGASGEVVGSSDLTGSDGSYTGYIYLKDVTQSTLTAVTGTNPWIENNELYVGGANKGDIDDGGTTVVAGTTSPMICFGDGNTVDIYDDGGSKWVKNVMTLDNGETWDATGTSANSTDVYARYFFADGALRYNDANFSNTNNNNKWFGHIKREYLQNILEYDGTAKTRDVVKYNSWFEDAMAPAPPNNTNEKALTVIDSYTESYPARGEKVVLRLRESSSAVTISAFAITDTTTNLITATCTPHSAIGLAEGDLVTITGTAHSGTYAVQGTPTTTSFTFLSNYSVAETGLDGSELVQNGDMASGANWTVVDYDGGTDLWAVNHLSSGYAQYAGTATGNLANTLTGDAIDAGQTYTLQFTVSNADLTAVIGGGTLPSGASDDPEEVFAEEAVYSQTTHYLIFTASEDRTHLWFQARSGTNARIDNVTLKKGGSAVSQNTDMINQDLKEKWIFGISHLYDGITTQESPVTVGQKYDGSSYYPMDEGIGSTHVVDFRSFSNKPECDITFVYDDVSGDNRWWHPRKIGFKIYTKRVDSSDSSEWLLFCHVDLVRGEWLMNAGDANVYPLRESRLVPQYQVNLMGAQDLVPFNNVVLESYFTETFGVPEQLTHFMARWKAQAIVNRVNWIGNVYVDGESFPDRLIKSPILRYDIFPNNENFFVDVIPSDGDEIKHLQSFGDRLLVFKKNSLIIVNVSGTVETIESIHKGMGVDNTRKVCATDMGIAWLNQQGVMHYDGERIINLIENKFNIFSDWPEPLSEGRIAYDTSSKQLVIFSTKTGTVSSIAFVYDFFTESFFYANVFAPVSSDGTGGNIWSNVVNVPHDETLILANTKSASSVWDVKFFKYSASPQDTPNSSVSSTINNAGFVLKTKDIDFGEPGVKKKIYKVYVTFQDSNNSGAAAKSNVVVAYSVNGKESGILQADHTDSVYNHFRAKSNCTNVARDTGSGNLCVLDDNLSDWTVAEMKPEDTTANNIYSFQLLFYNKKGAAVQSTFKVNDITIVYRLKKKK